MTELEEIEVVLGYGCHLNEAVRRYLEQAAAHIVERPSGSNLVITTGGRTAERSAPGVSEAQLMADHLRLLGVTAPIMLEESARTTIENIRNVGRAIAERALKPRAVVIFADQTRARKIRALARYFLAPHVFRVEPIDLARSFGHGFVQSTIAVPFDALSARIPFLEKIGLAVVERRIRRS